MKKILILSDFFIIMALLLSGCMNSNNKDKNLEQKVNTEISYIDSELVSIVNELNNISYENYKLDVQEIQSQPTESGGSKDEQSSGQGSDKKESEEKNSKESGKDEEKNSKIFSMKVNNILGKEKEINWDNLKSKIETFYSTWNTIEKDLKELGVSEELLSEFEKNIDFTAVAIKNEDKNQTLESVLNLYKSLPEFVGAYGKDKEKNVLESKYNLLICYKYAELEDWEQLKNSISNLKMSFSNISGQKNEYKGKEVNISSSTSIINEMSNSSNLKEKDIFFIKYKNLMQELNIILSI